MIKIKYSIKNIIEFQAKIISTELSNNYVQLKKSVSTNNQI